MKLRLGLLMLCAFAGSGINAGWRDPFVSYVDQLKSGVETVRDNSKPSEMRISVAYAVASSVLFTVYGGYRLASWVLKKSKNKPSRHRK